MESTRRQFLRQVPLAVGAMAVPVLTQRESVAAGCALLSREHAAELRSAAALAHPHAAAYLDADGPGQEADFAAQLGPAYEAITGLRTHLRALAEEIRSELPITTNKGADEVVADFVCGMLLEEVQQAFRLTEVAYHWARELEVPVPA